MKILFKPAAPYSLDEIAAVLGKSVTNVTSILINNRVEHAALRGNKRGPDTKLWKGSSLNDLVSSGELRPKLQDGEIMWL